MTKPPAERTLPNKQDILDRVLAGTTNAHEPGRLRRQANRLRVGPTTTPTRSGGGWPVPKRRLPSWAVPVLACAAVAGIVGAILVVPQTLKSGEPTVTPAGKPAETEVDLDLGPLSQAEIALALRQCPFMNGIPERVLHTRKVRAGWGDSVEWTLVREGRTPAKGYFIGPGTGRLTTCVGRPGKSTELGADFRLTDFNTTFGPAPTEEELKKLPPGASFVTYHYDDGFRPKEGMMLTAMPGKMWATALWLRVPSTVDRVRQRIVVNGKPREWFSSKTLDGVNFTQAWMPAPISRTAEFSYEVQFLDRSGRPVLVPGSTGPTTVVRSGGMGFNKTYKNSDYWVS